MRSPRKEGQRPIDKKAEHVLSLPEEGLSYRLVTRNVSLSKNTVMEIVRGPGRVRRLMASKKSRCSVCGHQEPGRQIAKVTGSLRKTAEHGCRPLDGQGLQGRRGVEADVAVGGRRERLRARAEKIRACVFAQMLQVRVSIGVDSTWAH
jgi:hypothetical protein